MCLPRSFTRPWQCLQRASAARIDRRTATRNGPAAIEGFDPSHDSADIFRERQIAAAQFFQGAQAVLSVIHRLELPATQQFRQLSGIDPITLAAIL
jgi:hypothetical protein